MNPDTIYLIIVFGVAVVWPLVKLLAQVAYKRFESRLPANVNAIIKDYARMAVQSVEQQTKILTDDQKIASNEQKKARAMLIIKDLLIAAKLPITNMAILSAAIEAAVYILNQEKQN